MITQNIQLTYINFMIISQYIWDLKTPVEKYIRINKQFSTPFENVNKEFFLTLDIKTNDMKMFDN